MMTPGQREEINNGVRAGRAYDAKWGWLLGLWRLGCLVLLVVAVLVYVKSLISGLLTCALAFLSFALYGAGAVWYYRGRIKLTRRAQQALDEYETATKR